MAGGIISMKYQSPLLDLLFSLFKPLLTLGMSIFYRRVCMNLLEEVFSCGIEQFLFLNMP
jgi:hypothetical protein